MIDLALLSLRPGAEWVLNGDSYEGLEWLDPNHDKPTSEEVAAEIVKLQQEQQQNKYQELRKSEYPSFAEQFDLLYHGGYDAWRTQIELIKNKYPKP